MFSPFLLWLRATSVVTLWLAARQHAMNKTLTGRTTVGTTLLLQHPQLGPEVLRHQAGPGCCGQR